jgi:DNA repair photolyase
MHMLQAGVDLYRGCNHACTYCFAPDALCIPRGRWHMVEPMPEMLEYLEWGVRTYTGEFVGLGGFSESYCDLDRTLRLTRKGMEIIVDHGKGPVVLSKAGMASTRDLDLLAKGRGIYGTTLTSLNDSWSLKYEPGAALPHERIQALREAKAAGIATQVSISPVFTLSQLPEMEQIIDAKQKT